MSLDEDIRRAERAQHILNDELVIGAFADIERACLEGWRDSGAMEVEQREEAWRMLRILDKFKDIFRVFIEGGLYADKFAAKRSAKTE